MISHLPALNATLNLLSAVLLISGYVLIRRHKTPWHRAFMIAAFVTSCLFLASYTVYHLEAGRKLFLGTGLVRSIYMVVLASHTVLAAFVPFLAIVTLYCGWTGRYVRHRRIARWTLPLWLYVSLTGVIIYLMLYHL